MEQKFELWDGAEIVTPSSFLHEMVVGNVIFMLNGMVKKRKLGYVLGSNVKVYLDPSDNFKCPDAVFLSYENEHKVRNEAIYGAPDLIVEVVSPGIRNTQRDYVEKKSLYAAAGVAEYWVVDPYEKELYIFLLVQGSYVQSEQSRIFPELGGVEALFE